MRNRDAKDECVRTGTKGSCSCGKERDKKRRI